MPTLSGQMVEVPLIALAYGRSGDKGDVANIGLMSRRPEFYPFLKNKITEDVVKSHMAHLVEGRVKRYELPGLFFDLSFSFLTECILKESMA